MITSAVGGLAVQRQGIAPIRSATSTTFEAAEGYESVVPLFASGGEAADHGQREIDRPGTRARGLIGKIARTRSDLTGPQTR